MQLQYNTSGLAHHRLGEALEVLAELGYEGVALTPDCCHLDPATSGERDWDGLRSDLERLGLGCSIECGARFVLDPRRKHWPNLVTRDESQAQRRVGFYDWCCRRARQVGAEIVSLWSGAPEPGTPDPEAWRLLVQRLPAVLDAGAAQGVCVCVEPEPGMLVESLADFRRLVQEIGRDDLYLTIDVGHLIVTEPGAPHEHLRSFGQRLRHVQVDDARRGVHEHLQIGEGEIDFPPVFRALQQMGYCGALALELSRHSHRAVEAAEVGRERVLAALRAAGER